MSAPKGNAPRPAGAKGTGKPENQRKSLGEGSIHGNLTSDPELRYTPTGRATCRMRVAYNVRIRNDETGEWTDGETEFYTLDAWGRQAENVAECLQRGDRIVATGDWQERTFTNNDGAEITVTELQVREIGPSMLFVPARVQRQARSGGSNVTG